jgi:hypothetical protein
MLEFEPLCLSTQTVISLRLKLKRGLNALLPERVNSGVLVFEYSIRDFFEPQNVILMVASLGCMLRFGLLLLSAQFMISLRLNLAGAG